MDNPYSPEKRLDSAPEPASEVMDSQIEKASPVEGQDSPPISSDQSDIKNELGASNYPPEVESASKINAAQEANVSAKSTDSSDKVSTADGNNPNLDLPDGKFFDEKGREITIRAHNNGSNHMIRAYDGQQNPEVPENPSLGAGRCNLSEEVIPYKNENTGEYAYRTDRVRINDLEVNPSHQDSGTGGRMLESAEEIATKTGAREIYGDFTPEPGKEVELRSFYEKHGFNFREVGSKTEVYKTFFFKL
jgi:GNAT superfamily N-acetyltransferase